MVRNDKNFKELGLAKDDYVTAESVVDLLMDHPVLMQRPILVRGGRAVIGRPSETILELLD
jgi:arsenate reductase